MTALVNGLSNDSAECTAVVIKDLGVMEYHPVWTAMRDFTAQRDADTPDEIWCVEHPPVYTQGQAGKPEHILEGPASDAIPVVQTDRGGQVTYHGPGQLVVYPLLNLKRKQLGVRELVTKIENSVVACLAELGICAAAKADAPGVYVAEAKIASLGLRVRRGCSFHGVGINVAMDLSPFLGINPCGYAALQMTQIVDVLPHEPVLAGPAFFELIKKQYVACLLAELNAYAA